MASLLRVIYQMSNLFLQEIYSLDKLEMTKPIEFIILIFICY